VGIERLAAVFAREADLLVEPRCQATTGIWLSAGPVGRLPLPAAPADLGAAVRAALDQSRRGVPHPADWRAFVPPVLEAAGVRSWAALQKTAALCQIEAGPGGMRMLPFRNGGIRGEDRGYHPLEELAADLPAAASDEQVGAAVRAALTRCE